MVYFVLLVLQLVDANTEQKRTTPQDSYGTIGNLADMSVYYKNLTEIDLNDVLSLSVQFYTIETKHAFSLRF
jgi:hypothetical protein